MQLVHHLSCWSLQQKSSCEKWQITACLVELAHGVHWFHARLWDSNNQSVCCGWLSTTTAPNIISVYKITALKPFLWRLKVFHFGGHIVLDWLQKFGVVHNFQQFHKRTNYTLGGWGVKYWCMLFKIFDIPCISDTLIFSYTANINTPSNVRWARVQAAFSSEQQLSCELLSISKSSQAIRITEIPAALRVETHWKWTTHAHSCCWSCSGLQTSLTSLRSSPEI